jgi:hypothetical protein
LRGSSLRYYGAIAVTETSHRKFGATFDPEEGTIAQLRRIEGLGRRIDPPSQPIAAGQ